MQIIRLFRAVKTTVRWQYEEYQHRKRQRKAWQDTIRTIDQYMAEAREKRFRYSEAGLTKAVLRMHRFELRLVFAKEICVAMLSR